MTTAYLWGQAIGTIIVPVMCFWGMITLFKKLKKNKTKLLSTFFILSIVVLAIFALGGTIATYKAVSKIFTSTTTKVTNSKQNNTTIYLIDDKSKNVEQFTLDLMTAIENSTSDKAKAYLYEELNFIAFATCLYQNVDITYLTPLDIMSKGMLTLFKFAEKNNRRLELNEIIMFSEKIKRENRDIWQVFVDVNTEFEASNKQAVTKEALNRLKGYSGTVDALLGGQ